jgi:UDP-N-acetylmuramoyl-L-alanyl-D-glutamate--2,6-diaminopimelate ligase
MVMTAVTGTNGKTSTTYLLKAVLEQEAGVPGWASSAPTRT